MSANKVRRYYPVPMPKPRQRRKTKKTFWLPHRGTPKAATSTPPKRSSTGPQPAATGGGKAPARYVHKQILVATGILLDASGHMLVTRRGSSANPDTYGKWEFPGGKVEWGETLEQAVVREIHEETGFESSVVAMLPVSHTHTVAFRDVRLQIVVFAFLLRPLRRGPARDADATLEERWVRPDEMDFAECLAGMEPFVKVLRKGMADGSLQMKGGKQ